MSGHSKWHSIKHQKGIADAKRGQLFTKLSKEIIISVRSGGASPEGNARLRLAIQKAKDARMPGENIQRAIQKGEGTLEGSQLVEATYEGYGAGGAAIMVDIVSDNKNRAVQELRSAFTRGGGNLGENGSVAWMFETRGVIGISAEGRDLDEITLQAIDAGAEDVAPQGDYIEIYTTPTELEKIRKALEAQSLEIDSAEVRRVAKTMCTLDEHAAFQVLRLLNKLEEMEDVQKVDSNVDFTDEMLEKYEAQIK